VFFTNRCGWEEGVLFGGASWAVDSRGATIAGPAPALEESLLIAHLSRAAAARARTLTPIPYAERLELWSAVTERRDA
jgi:hypothetical protein